MKKRAPSSNKKKFAHSEQKEDATAENENAVQPDWAHSLR
jgi:hypothetical protein